MNVKIEQRMSVIVEMKILDLMSCLIEDRIKNKYIMNSLGTGKSKTV